MTVQPKGKLPHDIEYYERTFCQCGMPTTVHYDEILDRHICNICGKRLYDFD